MRYLAALLLVVSVAAGCNGKGSGGSSGGGNSRGNVVTGNTIPVGAYVSATGDDATFGQQTQQGVQLAVDEINAAGGINGKKITLDIENDESDASKAENAVNKLINGDHDVTILGEVASSRSLAAAPVCQTAHVPMISPSSTNIRVTQKGDYIFRCCFIDPFQGYVTAKFAHDNLRKNSAAMLIDSGSAYSRDFGAQFKKVFEQMGGKVVAEASYSTTDTDFKPELSKIKEANPEVLLIPGYYKSAGAIAKQARELGMADVIFIGGDGWDSPDLFTTAGDALEGAYFSDHQDMTSKAPAVRAFVADFEKKYPNAGKPGSLTALAYDAMMILRDALKHAKTLDGPGIRDAIAQTRDFHGVAGTVTIDKNRNADKPAVVMQVHGNAFKYVTTIQNPHTAAVE
jgi:branched-chain amino acid transport system substrate-binding protein